MAMYLGKQRVAILSQKYTTEKFSLRKTPNFGGLSQSTLFRVKKIKGSTVAIDNTLKHAHINSIKSTGKNLLNLLGEKEFVFANGDELKFIVDEYGITNDYLSNWGVDTVKFKAEYPAGTYTLNCEEILTTQDTTNPNHNGIGWLIYCNEKPTAIGSTPVEFNTYHGAYMTIVYGANKPVSIISTQKFSIGIAFQTGGEDKGKTKSYKKIQMSLGSTNTAFEPYKESVWQLPETIELGEWDELNPQTKEVIKYTKYIVFDGTEAWGVGSVNKSGAYRLRLNITPSSCNATNTVANAFCSHYNIESADRNWNNLIKSCCMSGSNMYIYDPAYETSDVTAWKAHLAELYVNGTPLMVAYELAEPTIEKIESCPLAYTAFKGGTERVIQGEVDNSQFGAIPTIETGQTVAMELIIGDENG